MSDPMRTAIISLAICSPFCGRGDDEFVRLYSFLRRPVVPPSTPSRLQFRCLGTIDTPRKEYCFRASEAWERVYVRILTIEHFLAPIVCARVPKEVRWSADAVPAGSFNKISDVMNGGRRAGRRDGRGPRRAEWRQAIW